MPAAAPTEPAQQQGPQQGARAACEVPEEAVPADEATAAADAALAAAADVPEPAVLEELLQLLLLLLKGWGCTEAAALRSALVQPNPNSSPSPNPNPNPKSNPNPNPNQVHQLALGPLAHSVLLRKLEPRWADHSGFEAALQEAGVREHGKYALRPAFWSEVDPSHAFYTPEEQAQVEGRTHFNPHPHPKPSPEPEPEP